VATTESLGCPGGLGLFATLMLLLLSGILLTRFGFFEINHPGCAHLVLLDPRHDAPDRALAVRPASTRRPAAAVATAGGLGLRRAGFRGLALGLHLTAVGQGDDLVGRSSLHWLGFRGRLPSRRSV
jgi:hypothetical protein